MLSYFHDLMPGNLNSRIFLKFLEITDYVETHNFEQMEPLNQIFEVQLYSMKILNL